MRRVPPAAAKSTSIGVTPSQYLRELTPRQSRLASRLARQPNEQRHVCMVQPSGICIRRPKNLLSYVRIDSNLGRGLQCDADWPHLIREFKRPWMELDGFAGREDAPTEATR
jgi:hypothetical protein